MDGYNWYWRGFKLTLAIVYCSLQSAQFVNAETISQKLEALRIAQPIPEPSSILWLCSQGSIESYIDNLKVADQVAFNRLIRCGNLAIPQLLRGLQINDETLQISILGIFGEMGGQAIAVIPAIEGLVKQANRDLGLVAVDTLEKMGQPGVKGLVLALQNKHWEVRYAAADALNNLGSMASDATPALIAALHDGDIYVRSEAGDALGRMGKQAVPWLIEALKDQNWYVRYRSADALRIIGRDAQPAMLSLWIAESDQNPHVRETAKNARMAIIQGVSGNFQRQYRDVRYFAIANRLENTSTNISGSIGNVSGVHNRNQNQHQNSGVRRLQFVSERLTHKPAICNIPSLSRIFPWKCR